MPRSHVKLRKPQGKTHGPAAREKRAKRDASGRRLEPDARRTQILEVVEKLFRKGSYAEIGVADVARAAGITQGLLYHYYPTKEALFAAAVGRRANDLLLACLPDATLPVPEQFERGIKGYLDFVEAHSVLYVNLFRGPAASETHLMRIAEQTRHSIIDFIITSLGLADHALPATRLSLLGYLGYTETSILAWLENRSVPRATLERLIFAVIIVALRMGLAADDDMPLSAAQLMELERSYKRHFALP